MECHSAHYTNIKFHSVTYHVCFHFALGHFIPAPVVTNIALVRDRPLNNANDREK